MSRVSSRRMLVLATAAAATALLVALGLAALRGGDSALSQLLGFRTLELAVPLAAGAVIGLGAWALLDDPPPTTQDVPYAEMACPVCGRDGTDEANRFLVKILKGKTQPIPPPKINSLLNSAQASLAPHLVDALKDAVVQELAAQRRELLAGQQAAAAELTELARRLEAVQTPLLERLRTYEGRIAELERDLADQSKENRELLKLKIDLLRQQIETERATTTRIKFN